MNDDISNSILEQANNFIEKKFGIYFSKKMTKNLLRILSNIAKQKNIEIEEYINNMILNRLSQKELEYLITNITIGETYFFRDKKLFDIVRNKILPNIIEKKHFSKTLKIWSAGCATGEEAFSIAIMIKETISNYKNWNVEIIATDINDNFLKKARNGIYGEWSFRGTSESFKREYFDKIDNNEYKIKDSISKMVKFKNLNLVNSTYYLDNEFINDVDIIFCRNVLIYFNKHRAEEIIGRFYKSLLSGGWLIVAPAENMYVSGTSFSAVNFDGAFLYNKNTEVKKWKKIVREKNALENFSMNNKINNYKTSKNNLVRFLKNISEPLDSCKKEANTTVKELKNLCKLLANEGKLQEALECCKKIIYQDKINPENYYLLATIQEEKGNITEAITSLKKTIYLESNFIMAYFNLGNLNLKQQKFKEAFKNFRIALKLLENFNEEDIVPHSEKATAGMLKQVIENINFKGELYGEM
ncbi:CheR family methyltransferase [Clostridium scatologenes]|uniref:MCP methyltransferase, CheR-type n=1 Tax=Clostridium scatologenes TaxID=1548 RepID=A0A0E3JMR8_CLOSL|nr:protein-glutamate O-methyltransferase CheR [Clostridium scatologenes]AKA68360.1 MCP methyltransferase, CheR-type [Clostridium scatologenes]